MLQLRGFGTFTALPMAVAIMIIVFIFRLNLIAIPTLGQIPFYFWLIGLLVFFLWVIRTKNVKRSTFNKIYLIIAVLSFMYWNSMFQWLVDCCPEEYESMSYWKASSSLSWIYRVPLSTVILIVQGLLFDLIRK